MRSLYVAASLAALVLFSIVFCCGELHARPALHAGGPDAPYRHEVEDRVMQLPEDGDLWHFVAVGEPAMLAQFDKAVASSPRLASLARQSKVAKIPTGHWWQRYYLAYDTGPVIMVYTSQGRLIYKGSGANLPPDNEELADLIELGIEKYRSDCGPDCKPSPSKPKPRIPDLRPDKDGDGKPATNWLLPAALIGGAVVLALVWHRSQS